MEKYPPGDWVSQGMSWGSQGGLGGHAGGSRAQDSGYNGRQNDDGLNPNRQRGFGATITRIETTTLNDMRARQGAVVGKFMNFIQRKNTVVIDLYDRAFFAKRPTWEQLANFVYNDLCVNDALRGDLVDVQLHSVKMLLFLKFKSEQIRDDVALILQNRKGVMWTEFGVSVRGYSLDATVKVITVLGASPETDEEEIKSAFQEAGLGEVIEATKGFLDPRRLPGVTNGKWKVRVKIEDPDKQLPSYIIRKEEGELWSLLFDGRRFVCWKCGSSEHIGDKCRDPEKTFEEVFGQRDEAGTVSWAAIVKGKAGVGPDLSEKRDNYAKLIRENNERKAQEKRMVQERRKAVLAEQERVRTEIEAEKQKAIKDAERLAKIAKHADPNDDFNTSDNNVFVREDLEVPTVPDLTQPIPRHREENLNEIVVGEEGLHASDDNALVEALEEVPTAPEVTQRGENLTEIVGGEEGLQDEGEHGEIQQQRLERDEVQSDGGVQKTENIDSSLEKVFGPGATRLAIEFQGDKDGLISSSSDTSDLDDNISESTPAKDQRKKRARRNLKFGDLSGISEVIKSESKKPRLGVEEESFEESLGAIAALISQHEVPLEDPGPICSKDLGPDLAGTAGGIVNHREVPPGDPEPPDRVGIGVLEPRGVGDQHEDVHLEDDDGQGSPRPSQ